MHINFPYHKLHGPCHSRLHYTIANKYWKQTLSRSIDYFSTHCYFARLNLKKMGSLQFCLPVFLGIHRNPKQKEFFNSRKGKKGPKKFRRILWTVPFLNFLRQLRSSQSVRCIFRLSNCRFPL